MGILELTALELGKEIKEKQISVREAVQASLERFINMKIQFMLM